MSSFSKNLQSVDEIAKERNWSPKRVRALIGDGLPVVRIGRQNLINLDTLDLYLQGRETPSKSKGASTKDIGQRAGCGDCRD
jgi:hypothetical protein